LPRQQARQITITHRRFLSKRFAIRAPQGKALAFIMPIEPDKGEEKLRQAEHRLTARMAEDEAKAAEKLRQDAVKAAEKLRQAELRLAARMAEDEAKAAARMAKAQAKAVKKMAKAQAKAAKKYWQNRPVKRFIKIDLLAEAREAEERWRNHPIKRAAWIAGFCVCVMLLWLLELQLAINLSQMKSRGLEKRFGAIRGKDAKAKDYMLKGAEIDQKLAALDKLTTNRFLWAPLLNALQKTVIDDIQVTRLSGEQKYTREEARTFGTGARKVVVPGDVAERTSLRIEAKDKSPDEQSYLKYKESLSSCDYFVKNLRSRDGFVLEGVLTKLPANTKPGSSNQFITFVLSSRFPVVRRGQ
jgi:hypothetical protein